MVIIEDFCRLQERDAMLLLVVPSLVGVPFKNQHRAPDGNLTNERDFPEPATASRCQD